MCEKCVGPIRRRQSASIPRPSRWSRATTLRTRIEAARRTTSSHLRSIALTDTPAHGGALERFWHRPAPGHRPLSLAQIAQQRAQVEAQVFCDRHRHVRDAVGVNGQQGDSDAAFGSDVLLDALDGHTGHVRLPLVQHDGLVVEQPPSGREQGCTGARHRCAAAGPRALYTGGKMFTDWPGLAAKDRFEGRDLRITTDLRSALRTLLIDHLQLPRSMVDRDALPGNSGLPRLALLRR